MNDNIGIKPEEAIRLYGDIYNKKVEINGWIARHFQEGVLNVLGRSCFTKNFADAMHKFGEEYVATQQGISNSLQAIVRAIGFAIMTYQKETGNDFNFVLIPPTSSISLDFSVIRETSEAGFVGWNYPDSSTARHNLQEIKINFEELCSEITTLLEQSTAFVGNGQIESLISKFNELSAKCNELLNEAVTIISNSTSNYGASVQSTAGTVVKTFDDIETPKSTISFKG